MVNTNSYPPGKANFIKNILGKFLAYNLSTPCPLLINGKCENLLTLKIIFLGYFGDIFSSLVINPLPR
jgi:hypothetical protein